MNDKGGIGCADNPANCKNTKLIKLQVYEYRKSNYRHCKQNKNSYYINGNVIDTN